jgi:hypothetical protein
MKGLKDNSAAILLGLANEILFEIEGKILPFVQNKNISLQFVEFKFAAHPVR